MENVLRCYAEKKPPFAGHARALARELTEEVGVTGLTGVRVLIRYDIQGLDRATYRRAREIVFSEPQVDFLYEETLPPTPENTNLLAVEALPGQFDQRADSAAQCVQLLTGGERPLVRCATVYLLTGALTPADLDKVKGYLINPVESREASLDKPDTLEGAHPTPKDVPVLTGFTALEEAGLASLLEELGLAMDLDDLKFLQTYFRDEEKRDPTLTEVRVVDTYWSDHCRHTTFSTHLDALDIQDPGVKAAYERYLAARVEVYGAEKAAQRPQTLMDMATIGAKVLKKRGLLPELDESEEINACSIHVPARVDGEEQDWLLMFKNETHNHPTEIEPFGGAATCIGGCIRDPLSGRAYVHQAMRITGSGDPRVPLDQTLPGKLPQRKLARTAAAGYSSYGNQIGLATGHVAELYHEGYVAKRLECGAVVAAAPVENVRRERPAPGDVVILLGGRTGRDGIGGATGSSKSHNKKSLQTMASEVQKGNAPEERKIQRLFRDGKVTRLIKRCNDFGAGGVSVAIGELADGLEIDLDAVRKKYDGLDGTELAISESQERMAVVVAPQDAAAFIAAAEKENLEAYQVATVTESPRMVMTWRGSRVADLSRAFLNTNGAVKHARGLVPPLSTPPKAGPHDLRTMAASLKTASRRGLVERFDGSIGAGSVLMPFGGKTQRTPAQAMAALLPVLPYQETDQASVMAWGCDPEALSANPFQGAYDAVTTSLAKLVAAGADYQKAYLTLQEFFEKLRDDPHRWGKPAAALLGALSAQLDYAAAAIGGKDSMSGTFLDRDVPPTLISFAIAPIPAGDVLSPEFKEPGHPVYLFHPTGVGEDPQSRTAPWREFHALAQAGKIRAAWAVEQSMAEGVMKMSFGNNVGFRSLDRGGAAWYTPQPGAILAEVTEDLGNCHPDGLWAKIGTTVSQPVVAIGEDKVSIDELLHINESVLEEVYPTKTADTGPAETISYPHRAFMDPDKTPMDPYRTLIDPDKVPMDPKETADFQDTRTDPKTTQSALKTPQTAPKVLQKTPPKVVIPVFPGTNCEYDSARACLRAGLEPQVINIRNLTQKTLEESTLALEKYIHEGQVLFLPGGFSGGDEPEGSGKFIASFLRNPRLRDAIMDLIKLRKGLILGICNGFQALIKLGLVPYGEIRDMDENSPTLTFNNINRHQSLYVTTRVASVNSPWMLKSQVGDLHTIPVSHGEGKFVCPKGLLDRLIANGQVATQYVDLDGTPSMCTSVNPNGSVQAIEGIFSPDGLVFGKMGHSERKGPFVAKNVPGNRIQPLFESGAAYFQ